MLTAVAAPLDVPTTLRREGIVMTTAEALLGPALWQELQDAAAAQRDASRLLIQLTRQGRVGASIGAMAVGRVINKASYLVKLLGERPVYEAGSVWGRVATNSALRDIAGEYLSKSPELKAFNLLLTIPTKQAPRDSQLWHRDEDDTAIVKLFIYLTDVTFDAGPLTYIPGTQAGRSQVHPDIALDYACIPRATDEQMAAVVPPEAWYVATASKGAAVLVDTTGWHKGGYGTVDRLVYTVMYTTKPNPEGMSFTPAELFSTPRGAIAAPWRTDADYERYVLAQLQKTRAMRGYIAGRRVTNLVGNLVRYDPLPSRGRSALCVGCRHGHEVNVLHAAGFDPVIGIDLLSQEREILPMDMHAMTFQDSHFDVVFACHSLEHAYNPDVALREWARVTKPGGTWVIEVPIRYATTLVDCNDFGSVEGLQASCAPFTEQVLFAEESSDHSVARLIVQTRKG